MIQWIKRVIRFMREPVPKVPCQNPLAVDGECDSEWCCL